MSISVQLNVLISLAENTFPSRASSAKNRFSPQAHIHRKSIVLLIAETTHAGVPLMFPALFVARQLAEKRAESIHSIRSFALAAAWESTENFMHQLEIDIHNTLSEQNTLAIIAERLLCDCPTRSRLMCFAILSAGSSGKKNPVTLAGRIVPLGWAVTTMGAGQTGENNAGPHVNGMGSPAKNVELLRTNPVDVLTFTTLPHFVISIMTGKQPTS